MKIEISPLLKNIDQDDLRGATIVDDGDYVLTPKNAMKVALRKGSEIYLVLINEIVFAESFGNDIIVHTEENEYSTELNLYEIQKISPMFIRINKSMVVNKTKIRRIRPEINMKYCIFLKNRWLDVNRTYYYLFEEEMEI